MKRNRIKGESITVRLPKDLAMWVRATADAHYNDASGIVRMAIAKLREGMNPATPATTAAPQTEEAA
jgi:hypothetical protein